MITDQRLSVIDAFASLASDNDVEKTARMMLKELLAEVIFARGEARDASEEAYSARQSAAAENTLRLESEAERDEAIDKRIDHFFLNRIGFAINKGFLELQIWDKELENVLVRSPVDCVDIVRTALSGDQ